MVQKQIAEIWGFEDLLSRTLRMRRAQRPGKVQIWGILRLRLSMPM